MSDTLGFTDVGLTFPAELATAVPMDASCQVYPDCVSMCIVQNCMNDSCSNVSCSSSSCQCSCRDGHA